ncbi:MAG: hypothetical protein Q7R88_01235 [bacterium]|nr:hypothetical protein [bacterium]
MSPQPSQQNRPRGPLPPPPRKPEPKLSPGSWYMLFLAAIFLDLVQMGVGATGIGLPINTVVDLAVGGALYFLFFMKGMLDWRLTLSVLGATAVDAGTGGVFPAWTFDIAYAWVINDGSSALRGVPLIGGKIERAVQTVASKGRTPPKGPSA